LVNILSSKLGDVKQARDQLKVKVCPSCGNDHWNFEVSVSLGVGHCWICDFGCSLNKLFRLLGVSYEGGENWKITKKELPKELLELSKTGKIRFSDYKRFFTAKGVEEADILTYRFRIGTSGKHQGKLVIPLYEGGTLVYIVGRDLTIKGRYYNIAIEKIAVLPYYLGTTSKYTLYLCEGAFDAIAINKLGFSAGVLLGTNLSHDQVKKIKIFGFKEVVVCLDGDALVKAFKMYDELVQSGIKTKIVVLKKPDDPNDLFVKNKAKLLDLLSNPVELTFYERMKEKICHAK